MDIKNYSNEELQWFLDNSESIREELEIRQGIKAGNIHVGGYYCVKVSENTYNLYHLIKIEKDMANAFSKNFKDLIDGCQDLLN